MVVKAEQNSPPPLVTREELLSPARVSQREWRVNTSTGAVRLLPFTSIGELPYTTYLKLRA
jgi:uncharacterized protein